MNATMTPEMEQNVTQIAVIDKRIEELKQQRSELEAEFLKQGAELLRSTKNKSIAFRSGGASVIYTEAKSVKITMPQLLTVALSRIYGDIVKETPKVDYKPASAAVERMLAAVYSDDFMRITTAEVIANLPCTEQQREAVRKKLKGANFDKDVENLMTICGFNEVNASDFAYMYAEAASYETLMTVATALGCKDDEDLNKLIRTLIAGISVDDTTKITVNK